jgi:hypothetical protein
VDTIGKMYNILSIEHGQNVCDTFVGLAYHNARILCSDFVIEYNSSLMDFGQ